MPRYLVERTFTEGLHVPIDTAGATACAAIVKVNGQQDVTWVTSYVSEDKSNTVCVYDGPSPEAIRAAADANGLPVNRITQVRVLDPYFYV